MLGVKLPDALRRKRRRRRKPVTPATQSPSEPVPDTATTIEAATPPAAPNFPPEPPRFTPAHARWVASIAHLCRKEIRENARLAGVHSVATPCLLFMLQIFVLTDRPW
ncbi:MAG: hypothetical protein JOY70_03120 [Acidisphaera sp.]|nr:hypothetical protein [Acidisphaera sp.]